MPISNAERRFHRKTAARCFNETWDYLGKKGGDLEDDRQMLHLAHASRFHWGLVGTLSTLAAGDWLISRVYASLNQPEPALQFAKASLDTCKRNNIAELMHTANGAMAREYAVAKDYPNARRYLVKASEQLRELRLTDEDRRVYQDQIRETKKLIDK